MSVAQMTVVVSLGLVVYIYFGYALIIWVLAHLRRRPVQAKPAHPTVSIILPVHNEEEVIEEKILNCLALEYPKDRLDIIVVSDGSTDATRSIVARYLDYRVRIFAMERRGKAPALNEGVQRAGGEILVFSDANSMLEPRSLTQLVENFADPEVGGVCGNQKYRPRPGGDATERGENLYWRFDKWLKNQESRTGSIFAADGSLYAIRRSLYVPIVDPAQADDIAISCRVVLQGYRLIYEPMAVTYEYSPEEGRRELIRKIRVTNHSVRALLNLGRSLWTSGFYSFELLSHKFFRHLIPFALILLFGANLIAMEDSTMFRVLMLLQILFYFLALAGFCLRRSRWGRWRVVSVPYFFSLANLAAFLGVLDILRGRRVAAWSPRAGSSLGTSSSQVG
jgi:cellulose synthase/poly-beta-1,6-N-acetylglucosamine synthase-like glycosyltransferase